MASKEEWKRYLADRLSDRPLCRDGAALSSSGEWLGRRLRRLWPFVSRELYLDVAAERYTLLDDLVAEVRRSGRAKRALATSD